MKDQISLSKRLFDLQEGEILGIYGPPGAGKSTLLRFLDDSLFRHHAAGEPISLEGNPIEELSSRQEHTIRHGDFSTSDLSALDVLIDTLHPSDISARETRRQLKHALANLYHEGDVFRRPLYRSPRALITKVTIQNALLEPPAYLLLDEPTRDVAVRSLHEIHNLLVELKERTKTTIILTTKDPLEAERLCDRIVLVSHGRVIAVGRTKQLKHLLGSDLSSRTTLANLHDQLSVEHSIVV